VTTATWPWAVAFLGGLAGSVHCLGMCGGFAAMLARAERPFVRLALYNGGRVASLVAIGVLSGGLGAAVVASGPAVLAARVLAVVAGAGMTAVALEVLGLPLGATEVLARLAGRTVVPLLRPALRAPTRLAPVAAGIVNAFLPCHLVWAFAAQAATVGGPARGGALMLAFGLGTVPRLAPGLVRLAGLVVLGVGLLTMARGLAPSGGHLDHGEQPGGQHELHQGEHGGGGDHLPHPSAPAAAEGHQHAGRDERVAEQDAREVAVVDVAPHRAADEDEREHRRREDAEEPAAGHSEPRPRARPRQRTEEGGRAGHDRIL
jgi:sulfite exporter TauE/SafE